MTKKFSQSDIPEMARQLRRDVLKMLFLAASGHTGSPLGLADIFSTLYIDTLQYDPKNPAWEGRDYFFLSCGHTAPIWYATLARMGFFPIDELKTLRKINSRLQGHPAPVWVDGIPGIEIASGSLGQGISVATGAALSLKIDQKLNNVVVVCSDGELQEGSSWEGILMAGQKKLDNLLAIVDYNGIQIDGFVKNILDLNPLSKKFEAFNWNAQEVDGHNPSELIKAIATARSTKGKPSVIIARTVMGKGVSWMEGDYKWHGVAPNEEQLKKALAEIKPTSFGDFITFEWEK